MNNPFETIDKRLSFIEQLLIDIKHKPDQSRLPEPIKRRNVDSQHCNTIIHSKLGRR